MTMRSRPTFVRAAGDVTRCARCGAHELFHRWTCMQCAERLPFAPKSRSPRSLCHSSALLCCPPIPPRPRKTDAGAGVGRPPELARANARAGARAPRLRGAFGGADAGGGAVLIADLLKGLNWRFKR